MTKAEDRIGTKSGMLTVLKIVPPPEHLFGHRRKGTWYLCRCECGKEVVRLSYSLNPKGSGFRKSCGCLSEKRANKGVFGDRRA